MNKKITNQQEKIIAELYQKEWSAPEIAKYLKLSLVQVYDSLIRYGIPRRSSSLQNKIRFNKSPLSYQFREKFSALEKELLISGIMLYFAEGTKTGQSVDFANSAPSALELFLKFLRKICGVREEKIRAYLYCFSDQNTQLLIDFWAKRLNLDYNQFTKPYIRPSHTIRTRRMPWGVIHIRYSDKRLLGKILDLYSYYAKRIIRQ